MTQARGRPRKYDPDTALAGALGAFWKTGYSGTSLDRLSAATGMNRPSLYAAFGDKKAIYLKALAHFSSEFGRDLAETLTRDVPVAAAIAAFYERAIDRYTTDPDSPRGCFAVCTAAVEAPNDPDIKAALGRILERIDAALEARLAQAKRKGELPEGSDPAALARLLGAALHSLAIRARAGAPRQTLAALARDAATLLSR